MKIDTEKFLKPETRQILAESWKATVGWLLLIVMVMANLGAVCIIVGGLVNLGRGEWDWFLFALVSTPIVVFLDVFLGKYYKL